MFGIYLKLDSSDHKNCTVSLSLFAGCSSDYSEDSTYLRRSNASLPPEPVNRAGQYLRGLKQEPTCTLNLDLIQFTCVINVMYVSIVNLWK